MNEVVNLARRTREDPWLSRRLERLSRQRRCRQALRTLIEDNPLAAILRWLLRLFADKPERPPGGAPALNYQEYKLGIRPIENCIYTTHDRP